MNELKIDFPNDFSSMNKYNQQMIIQKSKHIVTQDYSSIFDKNTPFYSYSLPINSLPGSFEGYRILHLSDLHLGLKKHKIHDFLDLAKEYAKFSDLTIISGDVVNKTPLELEPFKYQLKSLFSQADTYFVLGEHDYINSILKSHLSHSSELENEVAKSLIKLGANDLTNNNILLKRDYDKINLYGVDDLIGNPKVPSIDPNDINLCVTHNFDVLSEENFNLIDLFLSGHTHFGEFKIGNFSGYNCLKSLKNYANIHNQTKPIKIINQRAISYINPGMNTLSFRVNTQKAGFTLIELSSYIPKINSKPAN